MIGCEGFVPAMFVLVVACNEDDRIQGCAECLVWLPCFVAVQVDLAALSELSRCPVQISFLFYLFSRQLSLALFASRSDVYCPF